MSYDILRELCLLLEEKDNLTTEQEEVKRLLEEVINPFDVKDGVPSYQDDINKLRSCLRILPEDSSNHADRKCRTDIKKVLEINNELKPFGN